MADTLDHSSIANRFWQLKSLADIAARAADEGNDLKVDPIVLSNALEGISALADRYALDHFSASDNVQKAA
jgi:hypothetical protein